MLSVGLASTNTVQRAALDKGIGLIESDSDAGNIATATTKLCAIKLIQATPRRSVSARLKSVKKKRHVQSKSS